jgi:hypothetical protein
MFLCDAYVVSESVILEFSFHKTQGLCGGGVLLHIHKYFIQCPTYIHVSNLKKLRLDEANASLLISNTVSYIHLETKVGCLLSLYCSLASAFLPLQPIPVDKLYDTLCAGAACLIRLINFKFK